MVNSMSKKETDLGRDSIGKLLFKLAMPAIIAQLVNVLYNIVDRMFIGRLQSGDMAMAGVGVAFPIIMIVAAFSGLVGMGGAPLAAIKMGEKKKEDAEEIMTNSFSALIGLALFLTVFFFMFKEPILWAFGASDATIGYALDYLGIYLIGTIFVQIALGMNSFINTQGFAKVGMITVMVGAVINIVLDPILIFGFNMGVKGAALATIIGQCASAIWVLYFLFGKQSILRIRKKFLKPKLKILFSIMALGVSPFIMQATESLVIISMNNNLLKYGDLAVGAMTIMSSVMQIILLPLMGLSQGAQPIISYNYGANKVYRVKKAFKLLLVSSMVFTTIMWSALMILPDVFVKIFNSNNPQLMEITSWSIRIYFAGILLFGAQVACQQTFLALGQAKISLILALLRKIVLLIPFIYVLPMIFENKLMGVLMAEPFADIIAALSTVTCFIVFYKKHLSQGLEEEIKVNS